MIFTSAKSRNTLSSKVVHNGACVGVQRWNVAATQIGDKILLRGKASHFHDQKQLCPRITRAKSALYW